MGYQLSIIVPVFNQEQYLNECLDSIVNQTFGLENIEVILVNDKSTDSSLDILKEYANNYSNFKIINHEVNKGLGEAKNTGMKHVTADFVMFLDSDDFISTDIVEKSIKSIKENNCDLLIFNWQRYPEDEYSVHKPFIFENKVINSISEKSNLIFTTSSCGKIFHKNLYKYLKFPGRLYEDNISTLKTFFNSNKIFLSEDVGYYYRKNQQSITNKINIKNLLDMTIVIKELFELSEEYKNYEKFIKPLILRFIDDVIFWLNYYEWFYLEELKIVESLQKAILGNISQKDIDFYYSMSKLPIVYSEHILNINNYDAKTFLARYNYLLKSPGVNPRASLFIDNGNGFNEQNKITIEYNLSKTNSLTFDLSNYDNIKLLRFDPLEGAFIRSKIIETSPITNRIHANSDNSLVDEYQIFFTLDPSYILEGEFENIKNINIQFELNILNNKDLSEILLNKNKEEEKPKQEKNQSFLKKLWG